MADAVGNGREYETYETLRDFSNEKYFKSLTWFPEGCVFAGGTSFGQRCFFGEGCSFGDRCNFAYDIAFIKQDGLIDEINFEFDKDCHFGRQCKIGSHSLINEGIILDRCKIGNDCQLFGCQFGEFNKGNGLINGNGIEVGDNCVITGKSCEMTVFGDGLRFGSHVTIEMDARLGGYCVFAHHIVFYKSVILGENNKLGHHNKIGSNSRLDGGCEFGDHNSFGKECEFGESCEFGAYTKIGRNCVIGNNCIFQDHCQFLQSCVFGDSITLGDHCKVSTNCVCYGQFASIGGYFSGQFIYRTAHNGEKKEENGSIGERISLENSNCVNGSHSQGVVNNQVIVCGSNNNVGGNMEWKYERVETGKEKEKGPSLCESESMATRLVYCGDRVKLIAAPDGIGTIAVGIEHSQIDLNEQNGDKSLKIGSKIVGYVNSETRKCETFKNSQDCISYFERLSQRGNRILRGSGRTIVLTKELGMEGVWPFDDSRTNEYRSFIAQYCQFGNFGKIATKVSANLQDCNSDQNRNNPSFAIDRKCLPFFLKLVESLDQSKEIDGTKLDTMFGEYSVIDIARLDDAGYGPSRSSIAHASAQNDFRLF